MKADLQPFRVASVTTLVISTALAAAVTGGLLQRAQHRSPGTGSYTTITAMYTGATSVRSSGFLFAVFGIIDSFDYLIYLFISA